MSFKNFATATAAVLLLGGCASPYPVAVTIPNTPVLKGTITLSSSPSTQFTNGVLTCSGSGEGNIPVVCNDGRKGLVTSDKLGWHLTLNDGTVAQVFVGDAANAF